MSITGIPTQAKCDPDEPDEAAAWALVAMPGGPKDVPLLVHPSTLQVWSKHLYDCGFRHHPELQAKWYHAPADDNAFTAMAGRWLDQPPEEPSQDEAVSRLVDGMSEAQRAGLRAALDKAEED